MLGGTPRGFRDVLPAEALARERLADRVRGVFAEAGYLPVETPLLESREVLERGGRLKGVPFQLFDTDDRLLMLRPELTLPIARMVAARMDPSREPLRLRYQAPVVREQAQGHGQEREFTQMGVELVGGEDVACEVEVMNLLARTLGTLDVRGWTLCVSSVRPLRALLSLPEVGEGLARRVMDLVHGSDLVSVDEVLAAATRREDWLEGTSRPLPPAIARAIADACRVHGGVEALDELEDLLVSAGVSPEEGGVVELRAIVEGLDPAAREVLLIDGSLSGRFDYYTGVIFRAYAPGLPGSLASGGRYDAVLANLAVPAVGAAGFALSLERLLDVTNPTGERPVARRVRVAVPKGSLFKGCLEALALGGLDVEGLRDPGRHLMLSSGDVDFIIVRASDAPTFVAYGGADCGICGSDSLDEAGLELLTLHDLHFGGCRFVVAAPRATAASVSEAIDRGEPLKVASKYPHIAEAHFERRGVPAEVVELHGNIELAPLVGMADCIVDITATGTTLRDNDLVIVDDVVDCSARLFASPAAFRSDSRVRVLADAIIGTKSSVDSVPVGSRGTESTDDFVPPQDGDE